jgi:uncharacterized protein YfaT (DUF1175 family)
MALTRHNDVNFSKNSSDMPPKSVSLPRASVGLITKENIIMLPLPQWSENDCTGLAQCC